MLRLLRSIYSTIAWPERRAWREARTLPDLCDLTARWLSGELATQPGYYGGVDVDEDDAPGITEALIALNEYGVLTRSSQAGHDGPGYHGHWLQFAAVDAVATPEQVDALVEALAAHPHLRVSRSRIDVTFWNGVPRTGFGGPRNWSFELSGCHPDAIREVRRATTIVIYDTRPGPHDDLWRALLALPLRTEAVAR